jgi:hypothetical protein
MVEHNGLRGRAAALLVLLIWPRYILGHSDTHHPHSGHRRAVRLPRGRGDGGAAVGAVPATIAVGYGLR